MGLFKKIGKGLFKGAKFLGKRVAGKVIRNFVPGGGLALGAGKFAKSFIKKRSTKPVRRSSRVVPRKSFLSPSVIGTKSISRASNVVPTLLKRKQAKKALKIPISGIAAKLKAAIKAAQTPVATVVATATAPVSGRAQKTNDMTKVQNFTRPNVSGGVTFGKASNFFFAIPLGLIVIFTGWLIFRKPKRRR